MSDATAGDLRSLIAQLAVDAVLETDGPVSSGLIERAQALEQTAGAAGMPATASAARRMWEKCGASREAFESAVAELEQALEVEERGGGDPAQSDEHPEHASPGSTPGEVDPAFQALGEDPELLSDFIMESREHLSTIESQLLRVEQDASDGEAIHAIFRGFHTIKGLAGFLGLAVVQSLAHDVETLLDLARNGEVELGADAIDVILAASDHLTNWLRALDDKLAGRVFSPPPMPPALPGRIKAAQARRRNACPQPETGGGAAATEVVSEPAGLSSLAAAIESGPAPDEQVAAQVEAAEELDRTQAGEEVRVSAERKPAPASSAEARPAASSRTESHSESRSVKVDTGKLDYLVDMVGEMVIAQSMVRHDPDLTETEHPRLTHNLSQLARITEEVQKTAMSMRMVPIGPLFQKMNRLVRDLCRKSGKQAELEICGGTTELDRTIVEQLADPLMHMVRNSADHGVEPPAERVAAGKDPTARITLRASHQAGQIIIEVSDDGRGLDRERILTKAISQGLISGTEHSSEAEIWGLIFQPGFSTARQVTDVSGRGVGMDVVKRNVQKLRGRIEIQSSPGRGSTFLIKLPLTLAIIEGLVVGVGRERYVVPIFAVREIVCVEPDTITTVENRVEMAMVRGRLLPIVRLANRFGVQSSCDGERRGLLIVTSAGDQNYCLMVDELIGKQEVVIKSLGDLFKNVVGLAGGAILGDGRVGLILDPEAIFAGEEHARRIG